MDVISCSYPRQTSCRELIPDALQDLDSVRPATDDEEAWLDSEEQFLVQEEEWALRHGITLDTGAPPLLSEDAEVFNTQYELALWMQAQEQVFAVEEAEFFCRLEEQKEQQLLELANAEDVHRYLMMKFLIQGAKFLVNEENARKTDYQVLVSIQQSAQMLLELIDRSIHLKIEAERLELFKQCEKAKLAQREAENAAAKERARLNSEISKLKRDYRILNEKLEDEKDRTTCRICFARPRDVLPLPCMHFDYCHVCLHQYQRLRNLCPTCRCPMSGVLKYNLTIG